MYSSVAMTKGDRELSETYKGWPATDPPAYHEVTSPFSPSLPSQSSLPSQPSLLSQPSLSPSNLDKIIAIPATSPKLGSPFLRAYPPALDQFGIPQNVFLDFLDRLNRVAVASPPVQLLGLAGNIVSMVPLHTAQIVGGVVNATATISTVVMSKSAVAMHMRDANAQIFAPRGLKAEVAKLETVAQLTGLPVLNAEGKVDKRSPVIGLLLDDSSQDGAGQELSVQHRRIAALRQWTSPLVIENLPVIEKPQNAIGKMNSSVSERQRRKEEEKMDKERRKHQEKWSKDSRSLEEDLHKEMEKLRHEEEKIIGKGGRRMQRELEKLAREKEKVLREHEKETAKLQKDTMKDNKEEEAMRKILFLVIHRI
ncbi:hypothetical protein LIA77_06750 [Sarocladium implicatum]|nr:hypothetical protein LIA77_06750 [Sarocladium implicatum]